MRPVSGAGVSKAGVSGAGVHACGGSPDPPLLPIAIPLGGIALLAALAMLAACHPVGPDYHTPPAPQPAAWHTEGPWRQSDPRDQIPKGAWWGIFHDADLDRLETRVLAANQDLVSATARLQQARALASVAISNFYPQAGVSPSFQRFRLSANRPSLGGVVDGAVTQNAWNLPFVLSYEPDLFGQTRRSVEAANASYQAAGANLENVKLVLTAETAADFFSLCEVDAEIRILDDTVAAMEKATALVQNRHDGGIASGLDLAQEQALLEATRTQAILERQLRANYEHALAVLCGAPAPDFRVAVGSLERNLPVVPTGVPSDVLERRPDIARQERLMAAANAQIGVARSAYYPSLQLAASAGFESTGIASLISLPSSLWAVGATLAQPLFSGGKIRAGVDFANAGYQDSVAQYRQTVLVAFQEVEDALAGLEVFATAAKSQDAAVADSQRALNIALNRYTGGLVTYLDVVTAQQSLLSNQREAAQIQGGQLVASVMLVKALGGGWDAHSLADIRVQPRLKTILQP
ncbi:MAG TPA: efflux transporter outer membrane subunit [Bryobacteraceae bacterium]|jgi:multidrug efflux system outer membrane protein|nr:efflux transporter outer membrane subunit [Bryobacteraceae bacterium]